MRLFSSRARQGVLGGLLVALLGLSGCQMEGGRRCQVGEIGPLKVLNSQGSPVVAVTLNGHPAAMLVDSGAQISLITTAATDKFNLTYTGHDVTMHGIGGMTHTPLVSAARLGMGAAIAQDVLFAATELQMGAIDGLPIVGLFGADFLSNYDVVFALPEKALTLYKVTNCRSEQVVPPIFRVSMPFERNAENKIILQVRLNGQPFSAMMDSGASSTTLRPSQAKRAGVSQEMLALDPGGTGHGIDGNILRSRRHRFEQLEVGPETFQNVWLTVAPIEMDEMLLGADFLRHMVIWVSYRDRKLYMDRPQTPIPGSEEGQPPPVLRVAP